VKTRPVVKTMMSLFICSPACVWRTGRNAVTSVCTYVYIRVEEREFKMVMWRNLKYRELQLSADSWCGVKQAYVMSSALLSCDDATSTHCTALDSVCLGEGRMYSRNEHLQYYFDIS